MSPAPSSRLRGIAVGALTVALGVAAHGAGDGALPAPVDFVLLLIAATLVGAVVTETSWLARGRLPLLAALLGGQGLGHLILTASGEHGMAHQAATSWQMLLAHLAAALVCAGLIGLIERFYGPLTALIRAATARCGRPPGPEPRSLPTHPPAARLGLSAAGLHSISRRGPPVLA